MIWTIISKSSVQCFHEITKTSSDLHFSSLWSILKVLAFISTSQHQPRGNWGSEKYRNDLTEFGVSCPPEISRVTEELQKKGLKIHKSSCEEKYKSFFFVYKHIKLLDGDSFTICCLFSPQLIQHHSHFGRIIIIHFTILLRSRLTTLFFWSLHAAWFRLFRTIRISKYRLRSCWASRKCSQHFPANISPFKIIIMQFYAVIISQKREFFIHSFFFVECEDSPILTRVLSRSQHDTYENNTKFE